MTMYKPPENANRVKEIKNKFENIDKVVENDKKNVFFRENLKIRDRSLPRALETEFSPPKISLDFQRQLSDPNKRIIKRTPAFRLDKNTEKVTGFQRSSLLNRSLGPKKNDTTSDIVLQSDLKNTQVIKPKPVLVKSKSSHDFNLILNRFSHSPKNNHEIKNLNALENKLDDKWEIKIGKAQTVKAVKNKSENKVLNVRNIKNCSNDNVSTRQKNSLDLYTEPIPKELRAKKCEAENNIYTNLENDIHNSKTLKITEKIQKLDIKPSETIKDELTNTLKSALKKPLPKGPAPKKPPRTFTHNLDSTEKNVSFLHTTKVINKSYCSSNGREKAKGKADPKYMLNKLETALRNNKLRSRTTIKNDLSTTSGEDSDDSLLYNSKTKKLLPVVPDSHHATKSSNPSLLCHAFNLNYLNKLACSSPTYERLNESNSTFFISPTKEEPVYAEPFQFDNLKSIQDEKSLINNSSKRNSLYYLSSPVLCGTSNFLKQSTSPETESMSSFTSDLESAGSSPLDEKSFEMSVNIKNLIDNFENKKKDPEVYKAVDGNLDDRVDDLRNTLQETINKSFTTKEANTDDKNKEKKIQEDLDIHKFKTYVRNVSIYSKIRTQKNNTLFYCCLIVEMNANVKRIKFKFPHNVQVPNKIEDLCFPEAESGGHIDKTINAQCYSLVITDDKGERTFGYCRRVVPEGSSDCIPIAYCILSKHKSPKFYKKILIELESRHGISESSRDNLLKSFYFKKFPQPGETIRINLNINSGCSRNKNNVTNMETTDKSQLEESLDLSSYIIVNQRSDYEADNVEKSQTNEIIKSSNRLLLSCDESDIILNIHHDKVYENSDLKDLHELSDDILKKIFSSLLLERKVILISCLLSKLSSCVEALQTILYPFSWPHTFIPVLPKSLWDFVESPTPIICGILSIEVIHEHEIDNGLVVDLDEGCILKEEGDEDKILCNTMWKAWQKSIAIAKTIPSNQEAHSYHLTDAYLHMFVIALRTYKDFIVNGNFQKEAFIRSGKSRGIRRFLKWFTDTTMFLTYIDAVMNNTHDFSLFDKKISMYGSDTSGIILNKLLEWRK